MLQFDEKGSSAVDNNSKKRSSDPFKPVIKEVALLRKSSEPKEQSRRKLRGHRYDVLLQELTPSLTCLQ